MSRRPEGYLEQVIEAVGRARKSVPWPERQTLADGSVQYSGLTDDQINLHIAREVVREMSVMALPTEVVQLAAKSVFEAESELLGAAADANHFKATLPTYRTAAITAFRGMLQGFLRG
jgi:hypothetical protein